VIAAPDSVPLAANPEIKRSIPMATKAQIAANRANAKKSTGPTTAEGKAKSARNAITHGFAASTHFLDGEDPEDFYGLQASLLDEFQPATTMETILVEKMIHNQWLSLRAIRLQNDALRFRTERYYGETPHDLGLLIRYQTSADRAFHRAHAELVKAQKERKKSEIGFVPQKAEKPVEASRQPAPKPAAAPEINLPTPDLFAEYDAFEAEMAAELGITVEELTRAA
jgi:hypothetical protein